MFVLLIGSVLVYLWTMNIKFYCCTKVIKSQSLHRVNYFGFKNVFIIKTNKKSKSYDKGQKRRNPYLI